jgi:dipeptidase E
VRLYLSSLNLGNHPERLVALAPPRTRAVIIVNALDNFPHERAECLASQHDALEHIGFVSEELDLRNYFGYPERLAPALARSGLIWINGGNTFLLRRAMRQSGFDSAARALLASDEIVYAGFSAAACCAAPTLRGIELVDEPSATAQGYMIETIWEGLGLIDYSIAVHYGSEDGQGTAIERAIEYWKSQNMPYITLRDGEALVVDGDRPEVVTR